MSKKKIYFISDVHLAFKEDDREKKKRKQLLDFLQTACQDANEIYILGDLFDFWFEWYHVIPKYWFPILYRLRKLVDTGVIVNFVTGNHDFFTGKYLEKEIGIHCFDSSREFSVGTKRFFVAHGDGLAREDRGYRFLKKIIRSRPAKFLYKTFIPADLGMLLARCTSCSSRKLVKIEKSSWIEEYYRFAQHKFNEGFDYVLLGHIHAPLARQEHEKIYINCGDWIAHFTYAVYDGESLTLEHW